MSLSGALCFLDVSHHQFAAQEAFQGLVLFPGGYSGKLMHCCLGTPGQSIIASFSLPGAGSSPPPSRRTEVSPSSAFLLFLLQGNLQVTGFDAAANIPLPVHRGGKEEILLMRTEICDPDNPPVSLAPSHPNFLLCSATQRSCRRGGGAAQ